MNPSDAVEAVCHYIESTWQCSALPACIIGRRWAFGGNSRPRIEPGLPQHIPLDATHGIVVYSTEAFGEQEKTRIRTRFFEYCR